MNWSDWLIWGFGATIVLTILLASGRSLGLTRIDIPFLLGTVFTDDRDKASWIGAILHVANGWVFALVYAAAFDSLGRAGPGLGVLIGLVHALFVLTVGMQVLPAFHPRMATEEDGPSPTRMLEPPGFLALHYGRRTPIATIFAHMVYGAVLGSFYHVN